MQKLSVKNIYIVAAGALALGILFDYFFLWKQPGIAFVVYVVLLVSGLYAFYYFFKLDRGVHLLP